MLLRLMENHPNYLAKSKPLAKMALYLADKREGLKASKTFHPAVEASDAGVLAKAIGNHRL